MIPINRTYAPVQAFVDELVRCGLEHAVTAPGSRNAPLALTLAADERLQDWSVLDERSAGFFALGIAKATRKPVVVASTSGTAAANLLPAVVEAHEARVPLVVLTADRPPELRDVGAGQAIDQLKLYGSAAKWFVEVGNHEAGRASAVHYRALACRAYHTSAGGRPGAVHLNFPLREPLAPVPEDLDAEPWRGRSNGRPWVEWREGAPEPPAVVIEELAREVTDCPWGAIVCGPAVEEVAVPAARLAAAAGWPLLAEPTSGVRSGPHDRSHVIAHYDALLRSDRFAADHAPDLVIRIGDTPTSKPLRTWLERARQILVDPHAVWHEPTRAVETIVAAGAAATCEALAGALEDGSRAAASPGGSPAAASPEAPGGAWLESWRSADALVAEAATTVPHPFEPAAYAALVDALPEGTVAWLSSSMPVRDVETFLPESARAVRFLANRGANGIDGVASSAAGAAATGGGRGFLLTGELALLHDLGGLLAARRLGLELTILCVNNGGGGIFDLLPVARHADSEHYERHIATPSGIDFGRVAALAGLPHTVATSPGDVRSAAEAPGLIEVPIGRDESLARRRDVLARIAAALDGRRSPAPRTSRHPAAAGERLD